MRTFIAMIFMILTVIPAGAVNPDEVLDDPALEARAREISTNLRCMVCQNQSIDDSDATLARDLRILVRERLVAGDTNEEVTQFLVDRYGEFVLLEPRVNARTWALWAAPPILVLIGIWLIVRRNRRPAMGEPVGLTRQEQRAVEKLLNQDKPRNNTP